MLKAIVFDFDGVVVDSEPLHYQGFLEVAQSIGFTFDYATYLERYVGFDDRDGFRHILREMGRPIDERRVLELCAAKQEVIERLVRQGVPMIPGARALIEEASHQGAGAASLPIAIASGATRLDIELMLDGLGLRERFELIISADDVSVSKPHPQTYARAVEQIAAMHPELAVQPADCLAIEDTAAGIESATGAGLMTLGLATTGPAETLHRAMRVVPDLTGVTVEKLRRWYGE